MSKYKKGDKVVMEIKEIISMTNLTALGSETYLVWLTPENLYEVSEPLSTYTEPLEAKIRRQAAEITRLVADNKRLKAENGNGLWNIEQARAEGQNEAWELAREIILLGGYTSDDLEEIFNCSGYHKVMKDFTYPEAAAKVAQWEKAKKEIKDDEDCLKCQFFEKHNDEYPCSHCCHCYTSKFKQTGR